MAFLLETQLPKPGLESSRRNLVLSVLEEYHGPIVATVAEVLMRTERTTLAELTRLVQRDQGIMGVSRAGKTRTTVTVSHVKNSLLIMMQHNMVTATMPTERELRKAKANASRAANVRLYYTLQPLEALVRTRGPLFHYQATDKFGKVAGMVVDCFLRNGRRTLPEVKMEVLHRAEGLARIRQAQAASWGEEVEDAEGMETVLRSVTAGAIQKSFQDLVMAKYIDKVPKLDLVTAAASPEKAKKPSMTFGTASSGKVGAGRDGGRNANGKNSKSRELEERQRKGAAQTAARKRRMIGDSSGSAGGADAQEVSDEEDELPVEMRGMVSRVGAGSGSSGAGLDWRPPPSKRRRQQEGEGGGEEEGLADAPQSARSRGRGRGRSRGRGGHRGVVAKGKSKGLNMEGVFQEEGEGEDEKEDMAFGEWFGLGGGRPGDVGGLEATVLDSVVWRLGIDKFHRDFRNNSLLGLVQDRFPRSTLAYVVVKVMLDDSAPTERKVKEQATPGMSARTLFDKLYKAWPANKSKRLPDWGKFMTWMGAICSDLTGMVSTIHGSDRQNPKYMVNIATMVQYIRSRLVKCTMRDRYGKETARIMEILLQNKFLEQQQVAEMAMLPPGDARSRLYRLLRDRMVSMQEVPKRADRNPNATFFLWTIKHDQVNQLVTDSLYKAMLNMRLRRKFVYSNDKELFIHDAAARLSNDTEKERLDQVRRSLDRLDTALLRLDETLMLFDTF